MSDILIRIIARDAEFRGTIGWMPETANTIIEQHQLSPAMGEYLADASMVSLIMAQNIKQGTFSLRLDTSGVIGLLCTDATADGFVRGMISQANILDEAISLKLKLPMVGHGNLYVSKRLHPDKPPYQGIIELAHHRMGPIMAQYLLQSEQISSSVGVATHFKDKHITKCAGFCLEALPKLTESDREKLENNIKKMGDFKTFLEEIKQPGEIVEELLAGFQFDIVRETPVRFFCPCTEEKVVNAILATGEAEVKSIIDEGKPLDIHCDYCRRAYSLSPETLSEYLTRNN